jgi:hypothetical protein
MPGKKPDSQGAKPDFSTAQISQQGKVMSRHHRKELPEDDLARDVELAWLIRGQEEKVSQARGLGTLIFGGIVLVSIIGGFIGQALGIDATDMVFIIAVLAACGFGCYCTWPKK